MAQVKTLRRLRIQEKIRFGRFYNRTLYPAIRIEGNWLKDAGFLPNTCVYVIIESGKIVIKPESETTNKQRA